ncbi:MAG TPA: matrixin family metalloprotease, partial [Polyangiaceae bacterium]
ILYLPDGYPPAGDALAVTISTVDVGTGELLDTDIVINGRYAFAVLAHDARPADGAQPVAMEGQAAHADGPLGPFDLQHVVAHEMGHALGLGDVQNDLGAVMFAYTSAGDASRRAPSPDDVAGLDSLYAGADWRAGCSASRVGRERAEIDGVLLAWVSIGCAVVLLRRRRARGVRAGSRLPGTRVATRARQERPEPTAIAPP